MTEINPKLEKRIMRRVYGIWFLRQMAPGVVGMPVLSAVALWQVAGEFFVSKIVESFIVSFRSGNISVMANFVGSALYATREHAFCILIAGLSIGVVVFFSYKFARNFIQASLVRI